MTTPDPLEVDDFRKWATSPAAWFAHAEQLRRSSELLWSSIVPLFETGGDSARRRDGVSEHERSLLAPGYLLLAGFALEAVLKAAAIQSALNANGHDGVLTGTPPRLQPWVKTHNLQKLVERAGMTVKGDSLTYLQRFEKHLLWAGRYPAPVAPPNAGDPRGFDYACGVQDHERFQELYDAARSSYDRARQEASAWTEQTNLGDYRRREAEWMAVSTKWLSVVRPALAQHCVKLGNGDRGVLRVNIDTAEMLRHLEPPHAFVRLEPAWLPFYEFVSIVGGNNGVGAETARRWAGQLASMNPSRDVVLFLHSTPDTDGRWFSRFIFVQG
jgi:hypothetical protein